MKAEKNYTVRISEEYIIHDPDKVKAILDRVSQSITNTYRNKQKKSS